jgi:hypothetical protein
MYERDMVPQSKRRGASVINKKMLKKTKQPRLSVKPKKLAEKRISFNKLIPFTLCKFQRPFLASAFKITAQKFLPFQKNETNRRKTIGLQVLYFGWLTSK